jgi:ribosome assembly protein 4
MDNTVCVWDAKTGGLVCRLAGHRQWITSLSWEPLHLSAPSVLLASSSKDGTVKVWDVLRKTCTMTLSQHTDAVTCIRWGGDGTIYSASRDRTIRMWHSDGRLKGQLLGHAHWINTLALSTDHVLRTGAFDHNGEISSAI